MMPSVLRYEMILIAVAFMLIVFRTVNRKKLKLQYTLLWIMVSFAMILIAFVPQIAIWIAAVMGIKTTSNLILFLGMVALLVITFNFTVILSKQSERIKILVQNMAIDEYLNEEAKLIEKKSQGWES